MQKNDWKNYFEKCCRHRWFFSQEGLRHFKIASKEAELNETTINEGAALLRRNTGEWNDFRWWDLSTVTNNTITIEKLQLLSQF